MKVLLEKLSSKFILRDHYEYGSLNAFVRSTKGDETMQINQKVITYRKNTLFMGLTFATEESDVFRFNRAEKITILKRLLKNLSSLINELQTKTDHTEYMVLAV